MPMTLDARVVASDRVLYKEVGGEAVLLDLDTETYFGLNAAGSRFWQLLTTASSVGEALDALIVEYDADPEVLRDDVLSLLNALLEKGLLRVADE
jgi:hypothetical protein